MKLARGKTGAAVAYGVVFLALTALGLVLFRGAEIPDDPPAQVRESVAAEAGTPPAAGAHVVLVTGVCAAAPGLTAAIPQRHPLRRAIARGSREGQCLQ